MRGRRRGFTLVEVLVALAILSLVLVALLKMEVRSVSQAARTSLTFKSLMIGTREMDDVEFEGFSGAMEKEEDPYVIKAKTEETSQNSIPIEKTTLEVLYEDTSYTELVLFRIKAL